MVGCQSKFELFSIAFKFYHHCDIEITTDDLLFINPFYRQFDFFMTLWHGERYIVCNQFLIPLLDIQFQTVEFHCAIETDVIK